MAQQIQSKNMSSKGKFDVDKLNIDGSLKELCFQISIFNVSGCDFCMNDGTQKVMNNIYTIFYEELHEYEGIYKTPSVSDSTFYIFGVLTSALISKKRNNTLLTDRDRGYTRP